MNGKKILARYSPFFIIGGYILINVIFFHSFWSELFFDRSKIGARYGEVFVAEWALNEVYSNIISGHNPFGRSLSILYPFGTDFVSTDSGNGILFIFLRPFLSIHQSQSVLIAGGLLAASVGMYLLLRRLGIKKMTAFIIGAMYAYSTFLMPRLGHLNYLATYVFPWFYYSLVSVLLTKRLNNRILYAILTGIFFVITLYANAYYFIMLIISLIVLGCYFLIIRKRTIFADLLWYRLEIGVVFISILIFIFPWLQQLYKTGLFEGLPKTEGWGGAIEFSSDLFGYFVPSIYSYFLNSIGTFWGTHFVFARSIFEQFSYPGIVILVSYLLLIYQYWKKKLSAQLQRNIAPFFITSIVFWILTLGPFLHIFGHWGITVDDGIRIVIPLPYIVLHYIPFLSNIRVPARFIIAFIFFAYIVVSYLIDYTLSSKSKNFRRFFYLVLFIIFIVDHYFYITSPAERFVPFKAYSYVQKQKDNATVLQIPSVVRDGFTYFGSADDIEFIEGQSIHGKPMLGGYLGRMPSYKKEYYVRNPFLGYIGRLMDPNIEMNGGIDRSDLAKWQKIDMKKSIDTIDFLDIKYVLLDKRKPYAASTSALLSEFRYSEKMKDQYISVFVRQPSQREFLSVNLGAPGDAMYLGNGWYNEEEGYHGYRYAGKRASVMFKVIKPRDFNLAFTSEGFYMSQRVTIYINEKKVNGIEIPIDKKSFMIPIDKQFISKGINTIYFISSSSYRPAEVIPGSEDRRQLSSKFFKISLKER